MGISLRPLVTTLAALLALAALTLVSAGAPASAQDASDERARVHFQAGRSYFDEGDYEQALREFTRAYDLSQRAELFYNVSLVYERLGDLAKATEYLRRFLGEARQVDDRRTLEMRLQNLERRLAEQQRQAPTEPSPAPGSVEPSPAPPPDDAAGMVPREPPASAAETTPVDESSGGSSTGGAIAAYAVGGAGLATFVVFGLLASGERSTLEDGCGATMTCTDDDVSAMQTNALIADIGLGVAVVGGVVGTVLLLAGGGGDHEDEENRAGLDLAPILGPGVAGATARLRF